MDTDTLGLYISLRGFRWEELGREHVDCATLRELLDQVGGLGREAWQGMAPVFQGTPASTAGGPVTGAEQVFDVHTWAPPPPPPAAPTSPHAPPRYQRDQMRDSRGIFHVPEPEPKPVHNSDPNWVPNLGRADQPYSENHPERRFPCSEEGCNKYNKSFRNNTDLRRHERTHQPANGPWCPFRAQRASDSCNRGPSKDQNHLNDLIARIHPGRRGS